MFRRCDIFLIISGILYTVDDVFGYGPPKNAFIWVFLAISVADYIYSVWPAIKRCREEKKANEMKKTGNLQGEQNSKKSKF